MPHRMTKQILTKRVKFERKVILEDRLHDNRLSRALGYTVDMADVWAAVAHGRYTDAAHNINDITRMTGMDRHRVSRNLEKLHEARVIKEIQKGNDRLQAMPDPSLWLPIVNTYFEERKRHLLFCAAMLTSPIE